MRIAGALQVFMGTSALALSKKKTKVPIVLGVLLFIPQALRFLLPGSGTISVVINAVAFVVPFYYLLSAYLNYRDD